MTALKKEGLHLPIQAQTSCWAPEGQTPTPLESYSVAQADVDLEILSFSSFTARITCHYFTSSLQ